MECINCGKRGHSFRECSEPITSFGIVALKFNKENEIYECDKDEGSTIEHVKMVGKSEEEKMEEKKEEKKDEIGIMEEPKILMIRRKDSLGYVEFLRGKYKSIELMKRYIDGMTNNEKEKIIEKEFDELWNDLWCGQRNKQYISEYDFAKYKYETIKMEGYEGKRLKDFLEESETSYEEPEWGFPKGRRSIHESEFCAALREFREETGWSSYSKPPYCLRSIPCVIEKYTGSNGIEYRQIYYIGICNYDDDVFINESNKVQMREVSKIGWFSLKDAMEKIRKENNEKKNVIRQLILRLDEIKEAYKEKSSISAGYYGRKR
jgi:8-oxo-dGTP pyrophosphatase MutT (NUDIX family)